MDLDGLAAKWRERSSDCSEAEAYNAIIDCADELESAIKREWVKTSERMPEYDDVDDEGMVWAFCVEHSTVKARPTAWIKNVKGACSHWMPKPKSTVPEPPQ